MHKAINSGYSHISVHAQEQDSRAALNVGGSITAHSVQPQGEIRRKAEKNAMFGGFLKNGQILYSGHGPHCLVINCSQNII